MAARAGGNDLTVKEQQLEGWEEKLTQRAQALADSAKTLAQRKSAVGPLAQMVSEQGGRAPRELQELMVADPLSGSPHVAAALQEAERARASAVDARTRACQAWDEELNRQQTALNAVVQSLVKVQKELQSQLAELNARAQAAEQDKTPPEPLPLAQPKATRPPPAPKGAAASARPASIPPRGGLENRVHARAKLKVQVDFESDHNFFTGFSSDISEGGLFVATVNIQPLGSPVEVAFALPTGEQVVARGKVRWIREGQGDQSQPGMGIQFENLSEDARDAVHHFISQRDPMFYTE